MRFGLLCLIFGLIASQAAPVEMSSQTVTLPPNAGEPLFVDIDGGGLSDLLVVDPVENKLYHWRQRPAGFRAEPDQVIALPPQTAWVAACDVDAHPGLELLMSTAGGLVFSRQNGGLFESERHTLVEAAQVFTNRCFPILVTLSNNFLPVISAGQAVLYHRDGDGSWSPEPPLKLRENTWASAYTDGEYWTFGPHAGSDLFVNRSFRAREGRPLVAQPENEAIRKLMDEMRKTPNAGWPSMDWVAVAGDGREDLVLWQVVGKLVFKTDVYLYLRQRDAAQPFAQRPTQVLHCRGLPIPIGTRNPWSPVQDLAGDGRCELVLLEFTPTMESPSGMLEAALTRGFDCALTIRAFRRDGFSGSPDATVPVQIIVGDWGDLGNMPISAHGDFNGDGRPDLLVRRSDTKWNIFCSTKDGRFFAPRPALTFESPARGWYEIKDINGDGLSDIIWHEPEEQRLTIFTAPPLKERGNNP